MAATYTTFLTRKVYDAMIDNFAEFMAAEWPNTKTSWTILGVRVVSTNANLIAQIDAMKGAVIRLM